MNMNLAFGNFQEMASAVELKYIACEWHLFGTGVPYYVGTARRRGLPCWHAA